MQHILLQAADESKSLNNAEMTFQICAEISSALAREGKSFLEENQSKSKQYNDSLSGKTAQCLVEIQQRTLMDKFDLEAYKKQVIAHLAD